MKSKLNVFAMTAIVLFFSGSIFFTIGNEAHAASICDSKNFTEILGTRESYTLNESLSLISLAEVEKRLALYSTLEPSQDRILSSYSTVEGSRNPLQAARKLANRLNEINPSWVSLVLHPGIVQRADSFLEFAEKSNREATAKMLYCQFRSKLGFQTVFRGVALKDEHDVNSIRQQGLWSTSIYRGGHKVGQALVPIHQQIVNRETMQHPEQDHLISVSFYSDLSYALGTSFGNPNKHTLVAVFQLRIPVIDMIDVGPRGLFTIRMFSAQDRLTGTTQLGKYFDQIVDEKIESFVPFRIDEDEIVEVTVDPKASIGQSSQIKLISKD